MMTPCSGIILLQVAYHLRDTRNFCYQDWSLQRGETVAWVTTDRQNL